MKPILKKFLAAAAAASISMGASPVYSSQMPARLEVEADGNGSVELSWNDQNKTVTPFSQEAFELEAGTKVSLYAKAAEGWVLSMVEGLPEQSSYSQEEGAEFVLEQDLQVRAVFEQTNPEEETEEAAETEPDEELQENLQESESGTIQILDAPVERVLQDYALNITEPYRDMRLEKAKELNMENEVDADGFLKQSALKKYDFRWLETIGASILNPGWINAIVPGAHASISAPASFYSRMSVSNLEVIINGALTQGSLTNGLWTLSNGKNAFCAHYLNTGPAAGTATKNPVRVDHANLRKALYYGYNGPGNILDDLGWSREQQILITNDLTSMAYTGACLSQVVQNGVNWSYPVSILWEKILSLPDPENYDAYVVEVPGQGVNWQGVVRDYQPLVYGEHRPDGYLQIEKSSTLEEISKDNPNYTFEGAEYAVLKGNDFASAKKVQDIVLDAQGKSRVLQLAQGVYWVLETKAPAGYALNTEPVRVEIGENTTSKVPAKARVTDTPKSAIPEILVEKLDAETGKPLADALFAVDFYAADADQKPEADAEPAASWIFKTGEKGEIQYDPAYLESGDALYVNSKNEYALPLGWIKVQETKAPAGYLINDETFWMAVEENQDGEVQKFEKKAVVKEQPLKLTVIKRHQNTDISIEGAVFTLTKPDGFKVELTSQKDGSFALPIDQNGDYTLQETTPAEGYKPTDETLTFTAGQNGIVFEETEGNAIEVQAKTGTVFFYNAPEDWNLHIEKQHPDGTLLDGAEFELSASADFEEEQTQGLVIKNGILDLGGLEEGMDWYLRETKAPAGYTLPVDEEGNPVVVQIRADLIPAEKQYAFTVNGTAITPESSSETASVVIEEGKAVLHLNVFNTPEDWNLTIRKQDGEGNPLDGAEFELSSSEEFAAEETETLVLKDGMLDMDSMEEGKDYFLKETKAPQGYVLPEDEKGNPVVTVIKNEFIPEKGEYQFVVNGTVIDSQSKESLASVEVQDGISTLILNIVNKKKEVLPKPEVPETGASSGLENYVLSASLAAGGMALLAGCKVMSRKRKQN